MKKKETKKNLKKQRNTHIYIQINTIANRFMHLYTNTPDYSFSVCL